MTFCRILPTNENNERRISRFNSKATPKIVKQV